MAKDKYNKEDIDRGLVTLPSLIASAAEDHNTALEGLDISKNNLRVNAAVSLTRHSSKELTAPEKKALVDVDINEFEVDLIKAEAQMRSKKIKVEQLRDSFDSVRKAASILIEEMRSFGVGDTK